MQQAFLQALIDGDPTSTSRDPITYRAPNGMVEDSYYMGLHGNKLLHANQVYCKVMVIQPELDYFSRPADARALEEDLIHAGGGPRLAAEKRDALSSSGTSRART